MESQENSKNKNRLIPVVLIILIMITAFILYLTGVFKQDISNETEARDMGGERFEGFDDFYHADSGLWRLETTVHLLREQKFVSSDTELSAYLVYEAAPGELARIKQGEGRWKLLEIIQGDAVAATGWADVDKDRAERIEENSRID